MQSKKELKFQIVKKYLLNRLEMQDRAIRKSSKEVEENQAKIAKMRKEIHDLKTTAKNFNSKTCDSCQNALSLPTIHFMCGHTFHDQCIESDSGKRYCTSCYNDFKDIIDKKEQYDLQAKDPQQFFRDLNANAKKFHVVAQYYGRGLFSDLNQEEES